MRKKMPAVSVLHYSLSHIPPTPFCRPSFVHCDTEAFGICSNSLDYFCKTSESRKNYLPNELQVLKLVSIVSSFMSLLLVVVLLY